MGDNIQRRGEINNGVTGNVSGNLRTDERAILDALHAAERSDRPALLALYFNGRNWMLYDFETPRWLPRQS
jgi:hypothetical protein